MEEAPTLKRFGGGLRRGPLALLAAAILFNAPNTATLVSTAKAEGAGAAGAVNKKDAVEADNWTGIRGVITAAGAMDMVEEVVAVVAVGGRGHPEGMLLPLPGGSGANETRVVGAPGADAEDVSCRKRVTNGGSREEEFDLTERNIVISSYVIIGRVWASVCTPPADERDVLQSGLANEIRIYSIQNR